MLVDSDSHGVDCLRESGGSDCADSHAKMHTCNEMEICVACWLVTVAQLEHTSIRQGNIDRAAPDYTRVTTEQRERHGASAVGGTNRNEHGGAAFVNAMTATEDHVCALIGNDDGWRQDDVG